MKFDPRLFAGAALGGAIAGNTGDEYEFIPSVLGAGVGAFAGSKFDTTLPAGTFDSLGTKVDVSGGLGTIRNQREEIMTELESHMRSVASNSSFTGDFDASNMFKTLSNDNVEDAINHVRGLSRTDLNRTFINYKNKQANSFQSLEDMNGNAKMNGYTPSRMLVGEDASLADKQKAVYNYYKNILGEESTFATARVDELTPMLDRISSPISLSDGKLSTNAFGDNFSISLTQTLGDGVTTGYISNNNAYLANKFNVVGGLIAEGQGQTAESFDVIANSLGLDNAGPSRSALESMLKNHEGVSKEAAIGMLAKMGVSDEAMLDAIQSFESNMQWDEHSTSELLKEKVAKLNGQSYERSVSPYARSISNTVDYGQTIRYNTESNGVLEHEGTALRSLRTTASEVGSRSELQRLTGQLAASGVDVFSQVKADANTKFYSPTANNHNPSAFVPYGRNPYTVGRRAIDGPINRNHTAGDRAFEHFKSTFGGGEVLGSSVGLRSQTMDIGEMGDVLSHVLGGNITIDDGYSIANKRTMSRFQVEGMRKVNVASNDANEIALKNPLVNRVINGEMSIPEARSKLNGAESLIRYNTKKNQERVYQEFANTWSSIRDLDNFDAIADVLRQSGADSEKFEGLIENSIKRTSDYLKAGGQSTDTTFAARRLLDNYFDDMSEKVKMGSKKIDTVGNMTFADEARSKYNRDVSAALLSLYSGNRDASDLQFMMATDNFNERRQQAIQSVRLLNGKSGQVVAYNPDGTAVKLPESYSKYMLEGLQIREDSNGRKNLEMLYKGMLNMGENYVGKGFSINAKEQFILADEDVFGSAGALDALFGKGYAEKIVKDDILVGVKMNPKGLADPSKGARNLTMDEFKRQFNVAMNSTLFSDAAKDDMAEASEYFIKNVDMISDTKNTGYGNVKTIRDDLRKGKSSSEEISQTVWDSLLGYKKANKLADKHIGGLVDYALATTNEKASLATLANVVVNNGIKYDKLVHDVRYEGRDINSAVKEFQTLVPSFKPTANNSDAILEDMLNHMTMVHEDIASRFNTRTGIYETLTNANARNNDIDFFVRSSKFTGNMRKTKVNISALNRRAIGETGAGLVDKSLSWNAQLQMLNTGYTHSDLDHFAKFSPGSYNDLTAVLGMAENHDNALNAHFDYSRNAEFKNAFNSLPEDRREMFKRIGVNTGNNVDFYNLSYVPEGSFKSIPVIYDETRLFDSFHSNKTGTENNKRATGLMYDIIQADMELAATKHADIRRTIQTRLDKLHAQLQGHINPSLSGSTSLGKAALTRTGDASMQATVGAINGQFSNFLNGELNANRHGSYVAVSEEGALKRLRLAGMDVDSLDTLRNKHMERIGNTSLYRLKLADNSNFFGIVNREPATGPMSARLAEYIVDTSIYNGKGAEDSLFMKSEDLLYKYFQFGDYDFDNVTEYFMTDMEKKDKKVRDSILQKGRTAALDYGQLESFASKLGVKNNKEKKMDSLFNVLEKNINSIKSEEDWHNAYLDYLSKKSGQAGLRKVVSPSVTMLSASLNNSLMRQHGEDGDKSVKAARVLTHYFVENLLKAQHASSEKAGMSTVAEDLANARQRVLDKKASQNYYTDMLRTQLEGMLQNHSKDSDDYKLGMEAIDKIVKAEQTYMTDAPINPMEMGKANRDKDFQGKLKNLRDMINGRDQGKTIFNRIADEGADVASLSKEGYDRFRNITKQLFHNNKKVLGAGALGIAGITLAFQNKPSEKRYTATADVGRQTLAPNTMQEDTARSAVEGQSLGRQTEYLTPHRDAKRAVTIEGQYIDSSNNYRDNSRRSVFGDNINSAQVEYRE